VATSSATPGSVPVAMPSRLSSSSVASGSGRGDGPPAFRCPDCQSGNGRCALGCPILEKSLNIDFTFGIGVQPHVNRTCDFF
jgi:hypothetical protein